MEFMYITFLIYFIKAWVSKKFYSPLNLKKDILSNNTSLIHALHSTTGQNASYGVNVPHNYVEQGRTVGAMLAHAQKHGYNRVEVTKEVEDESSDEQETVQQEEKQEPAEEPVEEVEETAEEPKQETKQEQKQKAATKIVKKMGDKGRYETTNQIKTLINNEQ